MQFFMKLEKENWAVYEGDRCIYRILHDTSDALFSVALQNPYGDEVMAFYQIKRWYHSLRFIKQKDLTIYEGENKLGELHKGKDGYVLTLHGVDYYLYGGMHSAKKTVSVYERDVQMAEFTIEEKHVSVTFTNGVFGSLFALFMYVLYVFLPIEDFNEEAFREHYQGMYMRDLDDIA